jgi:hypothetical protein
MFTAAKDVEAGAEEIEQALEGEDESHSAHIQDHTSPAILDSIRREAFAALSKHKAINLIAHKRTQYWSADKKIRSICTVSKRYGSGGYWYAFHPRQNSFLQEAEAGFVILAGVGSDVAFAIPFDVFSKLLPYLNTTPRPNEKTYWHIHVEPDEKGEYQMRVPKKGERMNLQPFAVTLSV